jgi:predicted RNase H-like HicB family nuclease
MAITSIQLRSETRDMLKGIAAKGETYDEVIVELIAAYRAYIEEQLRKLEEDEFVPAEEVFSAIDATLSQRRGKSP